MLVVVRLLVVIVNVVLAISDMGGRSKQEGDEGHPNPSIVE